jgi:hypothetical protein
MSGEDRRRKGAAKPGQNGSVANRVFGPMTTAATAAYVRSRDLPRLLALWPCEIEDETEEGGRRLLAKLRRALRTERRRARARHWSYDLNRHLGLLSAYKWELAQLAFSGPRLSRTARGAEEPPAEVQRGDNGKA